MFKHVCAFITFIRQRQTFSKIAQLKAYFRQYSKVTLKGPIVPRCRYLFQELFVSYFAIMASSIYCQVNEEE